MLKLLIFYLLYQKLFYLYFYTIYTFENLVKRRGFWSAKCRDSFRPDEKKKNRSIQEKADLVALLQTSGESRKLRKLIYQL